MKPSVQANLTFRPRHGACFQTRFDRAIAARCPIPTRERPTLLLLLHGGPLRSIHALSLLALAGCANDSPGSSPDARSLFDAPSLSDARSFLDAPMALIDAPALGCAAPTGAGTMHGSVSAAETWTAAASPHLITFDINVSALLTIEPCAVVRIAATRTITIGPGGALVAAGASGRPVSFEPLVAGSAWASIRALGGDLSLTHAIVRGGGDPLNVAPAYAGAIHMQRDGATGSLHVDDVEIADSLSQGVYVNGAAGFDATSQDLRIHGSAGYPLHSYVRVIGSVPSGDYRGNAVDAIAIAGAGGPVVDDQTLHERGVPYHVGSGQDGGRLDVNAATGVAVLTIEPGVTIQFPPGGTLNIDPATATTAAHGALIAIGTADRPIVFTSDRPTPAAGDWLGIGFSGAVDPATALQHVRVEFAGGPGTGSNSCPYPGRVGQNDAAIRIFGTAGPGARFIADTEIRASARDGIDRGWRDDVTTDFLASNTFTAVAGCKQSTPRTLAGGCPATPPCP
jgi:hypothetical protein